MVSHDRYLVDRLATQIWEVRNGRLRVYNGNYQEFLAIRTREAEAAKEEAATERAEQKETQKQSENGRKPLSKNEQRRRAEALTNIENQIEKTEIELEQLTNDLQEATTAQSFDKIQQISQAYAATEEKLSVLMEEWEILAHE